MKFLLNHFDGGRSKNTIYQTIVKICPVCDTEFETLEGHSREKTVCSHSCSNVFFRSGKKNGNFKHGHTRRGSKYRSICFDHYPYKCALCNWKKTVEVHHIDGNNKNNSIENLIPLCPNHHRLTVMNKYKEEIEQKIQEFKSR